MTVSLLHRDVEGVMCDFSMPGENPFNTDPEDPLCRPTNPAPFHGQGMIDWLHERDIKVLVWVLNFINDGTAHGIGEFAGQAEREAPVYAFAQRMGYLLPEARKWHRGHGGPVDYENPEAVAWWHRMMDKVMDMGLDGFVLDGGPRPDYISDIYNYIVSKKGSDGLMISHSAPENVPFTMLIWAIDTKGDFSDRGILYAIDQSLKTQKNGTPFTTGTQSPSGPPQHPHFLIREAQFNAFCPALLTFIGADLSNPWERGPDVERNYKYYVRLHNELLPYIYSEVINAHRTGTPIMRQTPGDRQYLFGPNLLVAPVYRDVTVRMVAFPEGLWINYWQQREVFPHRITTDVPAPLDQIPLFIRAGAIIPMEVKADWTGHGSRGSKGFATILVYPHETSEYAWRGRNGDTYFRCATDGKYPTKQDVRISFTGLERRYLLRVKCFASVKSVILEGEGRLERFRSFRAFDAAETGWYRQRVKDLVLVKLPALSSGTVTISVREKE